MQMAEPASAGNLNDGIVDRRISTSFDLVMPLLFSNQPLLSSQDWASFAEVIGLGKMAICISRSAQSRKPQGLWDDMVFWL